MPEPFMSLAQVSRIVGPEAAATVWRVEHAEMDYGVHQVWHGGQQWFTAAGVTLLVEGLRSEHAGAALALQRAAEEAHEARELVAAGRDGAAEFWWQRGPMA